MNIGIVGTGLMGSQIALRLAHKGHKVTAFNRDKSKAEKLRSVNASITLDVANQPSDIGSNCDIALICVKDYEAVSNVSFEKGGLIENPKADLVVIQCSTIAPDESRKIADLYSSKRIKIISVPILGGISAAERGELILIAAIKESNVNLTLPTNGSLSEFITKLNSSEAFQTLSQKFSQLAQESGINVTGERLKNIQGGERTNLTGLAEKLQEVMGRVQPLRE